MKVLPYIAQNGVHHKVFGGKGSHNAIWDFAISPEGRIYFSLCSELIESSYARFYEYDIKQDEFRLLFKVEDIILPPYRTIRHSKIHTSVSFLPNGHLLMSTHTTDKSPVHPYWMPESYYAHPWEGFTGSHLIEYDPVSNEAHTLGIPVPFESIYGGIYIRETNRFYFTGYIRGHLYSYDLGSHAVKDYGQVTEFGCFRLHKGPDGKLYWSSRSGYISRLNPRTDAIEQLPLQFSKAKNKAFSTMIRRLDYAVNLSDGKMLIAAMLSDGLYMLDTNTDTLTCLGGYGEEYLPEDPSRMYAAPFSLVMDRDGVLWYVLVSTYANGASSSTLMRWDILSEGGRPEALGTLGTPETRTVAIVSEAKIYNDVLYMADTNHADDMPGILTIDLKAFRPHMRESGGMPEDPFLTSGTEQYRNMERVTAEYLEFNRKNPFSVSCRSWNAWKIWRYVKPECSRVRRVMLSSDDSVRGICGGEDEKHYFWTEKNEVHIRRLSEVPESELAVFQHREGWPEGETIRELSVPGRQYKAVVTAAARIGEDRWIVGTKDGVVGIINGNGTVYRLGRGCPNGPIHALSSNADGGVVYGVGGDASDLGVLLRYTEKSGLEELGSLRFNADYAPGIHMSSQPCCLDVSCDGKTVAVGVEDRMGTVYLLHF